MVNKRSVNLKKDLEITVMAPFIKESSNQQVALLKKIIKIREDIMDAILMGDGIIEIIRVLRQNLENPLIVKNHHFEEYILDERDALGDYDTLIKCVAKYFQTTTCQFALPKKVKAKVIVNNEYVDWFVVPILIQNKVNGHMVIFGTRRNITNFDMCVLEMAAKIISYEFQNVSCTV